jgi:hypothetical protein
MALPQGFFRFHLLTALVMAVFHAQPAFSATEQRLEGAVHWSGEVVMESALRVPPTAELSLQPGTVIRIEEPDAIWKIEGRLRIQGTADNPVRFETVAGWQGITVEQGAPPAEIHHAHFSSAETALLLRGAEALVNQAVFRDCVVALKAVRESKVNVLGSRFFNNGVGIDLELKSRAVIRDTVFSGHGAAALQAANHCVVHIESCRFSENRQAVLGMRKFPGVLRENRFVGNGQAVVCQRSGQGPALSGNHFEDNDEALVSTTFSRPQLSDNRFVHNRTAITGDQFAGGVFQYNLFEKNDSALRLTRRASPLVNYNIFRDNDVALFCDLGSYPLVRDNNFLGNPLAIKLGPLQSAAGALPQGAMVGGEEALERAPECQMAPQQNGPPADQDYVDARDNWWGAATKALRSPESSEQPTIFFDRDDYAAVDYGEGMAGAGGPVDRVLYDPWRMAPVNDAGPRW